MRFFLCLQSNSSTLHKPFGRLIFQSARHHLTDVRPLANRTGADFAEGIILVARLTVTAVAAREVVTDLAHSTAVCPHLTLINV